MSIHERHFNSVTKKHENSRFSREKLELEEKHGQLTTNIWNLITQIWDEMSARQGDGRAARPHEHPRLAQEVKELLALQKEVLGYPEHQKGLHTSEPYAYANADSWPEQAKYDAYGAGTIGYEINHAHMLEELPPLAYSLSDAEARYKAIKLAVLPELRSKKATSR